MRQEVGASRRHLEAHNVVSLQLDRDLAQDTAEFEWWSVLVADGGDRVLAYVEYSVRETSNIGRQIVLSRGDAVDRESALRGTRVIHIHLE